MLSRCTAYVSPITDRLQKLLLIDIDNVDKSKKGNLIRFF